MRINFFEARSPWGRPLPCRLCAVPPHPSVTRYFRGICCVSGRLSHTLLSRSCFVFSLPYVIILVIVIVHMCVHENVFVEKWNNTCLGLGICVLQPSTFGEVGLSFFVCLFFKLMDTCSVYIHIDIFLMSAEVWWNWNSYFFNDEDWVIVILVGPEWDWWRCKKSEHITIFLDFFK